MSKTATSMPPASPPPEPAAPQPRDWFIAAIECDGSVSTCLDAVLGELGRRTQFAVALKTALELDSPPGVDAMTHLGLQLRALENTLRFRLGILRPERPAAWFRAPAATNTGPFQVTLLEEPVFAPYEGAAAARVKAGLDAAWREARDDGLPFDSDAPCLWRTLLQCRRRLERIVALPAPFHGLRFDVLPDGLTTELESRPLRAFLLNVRAEAQATLERLSACHAQLLETSEKLWAAQLEEARQGGAPRAQAAGTLREELKRRRAGVRAFLTKADVEALKFMGFEDLPSPDALRQRYLAMAKRLHPDRQGGDDQAFKLLTGAYGQLEKRASARSER